MPTLERAMVIQRYMGGAIYFDEEYECYRVMRSDSPALDRWPNHYQPVK